MGDETPPGFGGKPSYLYGIPRTQQRPDGMSREAWLEHLAEQLRCDIEHLQKCETQAEWDACVAAMLWGWIAADRPELTRIEFGAVQATGGHRALALMAVVREGFEKRSQRPRKRLEALEDWWWIERNGCRSFAEAASALANWRKIKPETARHRVARAEAETGNKLPRRAIRRKPQPFISVPKRRGV